MPNVIWSQSPEDMAFHLNRVFLGDDFTSCKLYVAIECFRGKQMTPFSYWLHHRYSIGITCQALDFQLLIFRLAWNIYDGFWDEDTHLPPLSPSTQSPEYIWLLTFLKERKEIIVNLESIDGFISYQISGIEHKTVDEQISSQMVYVIKSKSMINWSFSRRLT